MSTTIEVRRKLSTDEVREVLSLIDTVADADGTFPLSEHVVLHLRHGGDADVRSLLARADDGHLVGYAHLDVTDMVEGPSAELAVLPDERRRGVGHALVAELITLAHTVDVGTGRLRLWAHGENSAARGLAASMGFTRTRVLWQMRRSLYAALPTAEIPHDVALRTFLPGLDDDAWLTLNATAFADLPDQGRWEHADLARRTSEEWFDPSGFLLAESGDGSLAGFHWTKVHGGHHHHDHDHDPIGEVYVIGVAPAWRGTGLGRALLLAGLQHLRSQGLTQAMLYVDADNHGAIRLYESLGFTRWDTDVLYRR